MRFSGGSKKITLNELTICLFLAIISVLISALYEKQFIIDKFDYPRYTIYEGYIIDRTKIDIVTPVEYSKYQDIEGERWSISVLYSGEIIVFYNKTKADAQTDYDFFRLQTELNQLSEER